MADALRVLLLEDRVSDARLMILALREAGFEPLWERVDSEAEFVEKLQSDWDIILADYSLPQFDAVTALRLLRIHQIATPMIIVTGTVGEETAVNAMKEGAADYLLKDRLGRLGQAVSNALQQRGLARELVAKQQHLAESEERYRRLIEVLPDAVAIFTGEKLTFCNPAFLQLVGAKSYAEVAGRSPFALTEERQHAAMRQRIEFMLQTGLPVPLRENEYIRLDGSRVAVAVAATPVSFQGSPSHLIVAHDLTELRRSTELLRSVMRSVLDAIITIDEKGNIRSVNYATEQMFGYATSELVGQNVKLLMPERHKTEHDNYIHNYLQTGKANVIGIGREVEGLRRDGSLFPAELDVSEFSLDGVRHFTGVLRDITDRKLLEAQFRQSQKMEAIGQLAGGIAHDFNNLLCVINGFTELLMQEKSPDSPDFGSLQQIRLAGARASELTTQLLAFSRKSLFELKVLDLNAITSNTEQMLLRLLSEDIELTTSLANGLWRVRGDSGQIEQVLMNLVVNARDALPNGGFIRIVTRNVDVQPSQAGRATNIQPGKYVELAVTDNGGGMTPEIKARIFDPFFTTKEHGKGTGLGLSVVHGIVTQIGGHIEVDSTPGAGSTFCVRLPAEMAAEPTSRAGQSSTALNLRGNETILLVEDEPMVLEITKATLQTYGYDVVSATSGQQALRWLDNNKHGVHLLITDVVMPEMDGRMLANAVHVSRPDLPVLFLSGYTADEVLRRGIMAADVEFLQKPFTPQSLVRKAREVLDRTKRV